MIIGELVLSVKTLEIELKAERAKSEAMRHNLRALATAGPSISPRGQETPRAPTSVYKNASQAAQPRYLVGGGVQYKSFRQVPPSPSPPTLNLDQRRPLPTTPHHAQTARPGAIRNALQGNVNSPSSARPTSASVSRTAPINYNTRARVAALFAEPSFSRSTTGSTDAVDNFDINDVIIDSPFDSPFDQPSSGALATTSNGNILNQAEPVLQNGRLSSNMSSSTELAVPANLSGSENQAEPIKLNLDAAGLSKSHSIERTASGRPTVVPVLSASADLSWSRDAQTDSGAAIHSPGSVFIDLSSDEPLTSERLLEALQHALHEGSRQKIELERARKLLLVHNMQAPVASSYSAGPSEGTKSSTDPNVPPTMLDSKPSSLKLLMKRIKPKAMSVSVSHPVGLRVGSYRAEQDEFERIFYLTKDFIDTPSAAQRAEESKFPEQFRRRIGIMKESLDYDVDFAECGIFAIPAFVLDNLCKTTRFTLSDNQLSEIPNQIRKFDKLEEFNLANNLLLRIPAAIANLRALRALSVSNNKISEIPVELAHLPLLEYLDLAENQISEVPKHIGWHHSLKHLNISKNPITTLPAEISLCSQLQHLEASTCFLKKLPKELCALPELEILDLSHNALKELPSGIGLMPKLKQLHVENNQLTDFPLSLGHDASPLFASGKFSYTPNPLNPKVFNEVLSGQDTMAEFLTRRAVDNWKSIKHGSPALPKIPSVAPFKPSAADSERWTLQEKMLCCGDWVSHTIENYLRPAISTLFTSLTTVSELESPQLRRIIHVMRLVKSVIWRSEGLLRPAPFQKDRVPTSSDELEEIKAILTEEFMILDSVLRSLQPIIRTAAISEKIGDTVTVVNVVHFSRDLLFVLVLDESRAVSSSHNTYYQRHMNQPTTESLPSPTSPTTSHPGFSATMRNTRLSRTDSSPVTPANSVLLPLPESSNVAPSNAPSVGPSELSPAALPSSSSAIPALATASNPTASDSESAPTHQGNTTGAPSSHVPVGETTNNKNAVSPPPTKRTPPSATADTITDSESPAASRDSE